MKLVHFLFKNDQKNKIADDFIVDWLKILELKPNPYINDASGITVAEIFSKTKNQKCINQCKNQFKNYIESYSQPK